MWDTIYGAHFPSHSVVQTQGHKDFLGYKPNATCPYKWVTYKEFGGMVDKAKYLLQEAGIGPGDKVSGGRVCLNNKTPSV